MSEYPYRTPYEEGRSDGKDESREQIATLQAKVEALEHSQELSEMLLYEAQKRIEELKAQLAEMEALLARALKEL